MHLFTLTNYKKVVFYCICSESNMEEKKIASNKERKRKKKIRLSLLIFYLFNNINKRFKIINTVKDFFLNILLPWLVGKVPRIHQKHLSNLYITQPNHFTV